MDNRLLEAARLGNVHLLSQLLQENPLLLSEVFLLSPNENPLHVATKANQLNFVHEIMKIKPELAHELNNHGFRPLDIASACGHVEIVKALLVSGAQRLKGREGRTALHYAALKGRVEVINELVSACSECVKDMTIVGETALHLAAKYCQIEALKTLIERVDVENQSLEEVLNWSDRDGNTVLHLAISGGQLETVELLLSSRVHTTNKLLELNAMNSKGLTPLDIVDILIESSNNTSIPPKLTKILQDAGALRGKDIAAGISPAPALPEDHPSKDWFTYFKFQPNRDQPGETRGALLVISALIVTVTFQGVISPPSLLTKHDTLNVISTVFLFCNTLGFSTAATIIWYLTTGFPFQRELVTSLGSLALAYEIVSSTHTGSNQWILLNRVLMVVAWLLPMALRKLPKLKKKCFGG